VIAEPVAQFGQGVLVEHSDFGEEARAKRVEVRSQEVLDLVAVQIR
jgi:hypothetical protein